MIILGTRGVTYTVASGSFVCPKCQGEREYRHKKVRRFFAVFNLPLIPLGQMGEYVECQSCLSTYQELDVLEFDPEVQRSEFEAVYLRAIKRVMVLMMLADDEIDSTEIEAIRQIFVELGGQPLTEAEVLAEVEVAKAEGQPLHEYLAEVIGKLNDQGKEAVIRATWRVAQADGVYHDDERALLAHIAGELNLGPARLKELVERLESEA